MAIFPSGHREDGANSVPGCLLVIPESNLAAFMLLITWQTFIQVGAHRVRVQKALAGAVPEIPVSSWIGVSDAPHCRILLGFFQAPVSHWVTFPSMTLKTQLAWAHGVPAQLSGPYFRTVP